MSAYTDKWASTPRANLIRRVASGTYYVRAHVHGEKLFRSLKTRSYEVAAFKLDEVLSEARGQPAVGVKDDDATVAQCFAEYLTALRRKGRRAATLQTYSYVPGELDQANGGNGAVGRTPARDVTPGLAAAWMDAVAYRYSSAGHNVILCALRGALQVAVDRGICRVNPAAAIVCKDKPPKQRKLPTAEQLTALFADLRKPRGRHNGGRNCSYYFCAFLLYSGLRAGTARAMTPDMVDREAGFFTIDGSLLKTGRSGHIYRFPILPKMSTLLDELDARFGKAREKLLPIRGCWIPLLRACKRLGLPPMNHHTFRHIFTTVCISQGVPIPIIARWRGDSDGGTTLLRVYHHLTDETSRRFAESVKLP